MGHFREVSLGKIIGFSIVRTFGEYYSGFEGHNYIGK